MTPEQHLFQRDGSRTWYEPKWRERISVGTEPKTFVPVELLEAALGFLRRAEPLLPVGVDDTGHSLGREVTAFLSTFGHSAGGNNGP